jgi:hypothetical protein
MKVLSPILRGGVNIYINGKLVASKHNNVTASFILSLVKAIIGVSSTYGGYFAMPSTAVVKLYRESTPVTSVIMSHVSFTEETVSGYEHTRVVYSFSDASRTKYSFDYLQLWTASTHSLLLHVSDAFLNTPLIKKPQDVVQVDWWVEMVSGQPFANMNSYLQQLQATYCSSTCFVPSAIPNMGYGYSVFNVYFTLLALPNAISVARDIKTPLTNFLVNVLATASDIKPEGITAVVCYDLCDCVCESGASQPCIAQITSSAVSGFVSEFIGDNYVYVAFNFENPCPSGQYVIPVTTLGLGNQPPVQFAIAPVPSSGTGNSAFVIKIPYGQLTLKNLFTHQGE